MTHISIFTVYNVGCLSIFAIFLDNTSYHGIRTWEGMLEKVAFGIKLLGLIDIGEKACVTI